MRLNKRKRENISNVVQIFVFREPYSYICMIYIDTTRRIERRVEGGRVRVHGDEQPNTTK